MKDELIAAVGRATRLPADQATFAVEAMLRFFTARLPSALAGELHSLLDGIPPPASHPIDRPPLQ